MKDALGQSESVAMRVQIAGVFLQQGQDAIELLVSPASESGGVLELAFHGVALGTPSCGQRATVPIGPGMREAKEAQDLDDLIGEKQLTVRRQENWREANTMD